MLPSPDLYAEGRVTKDHLPGEPAEPVPSYEDRLAGTIEAGHVVRGAFGYAFRVTRTENAPDPAGKGRWVRLWAESPRGGIVRCWEGRPSARVKVRV